MASLYYSTHHFVHISWHKAFTHVFSDYGSLLHNIHGFWSLHHSQSSRTGLGSAIMVWLAKMSPKRRYTREICEPPQPIPVNPYLVGKDALQKRVHKGGIGGVSYMERPGCKECIMMEPATHKPAPQSPLQHPSCHSWAGKFHPTRGKQSLRLKPQNDGGTKKATSTAVVVRPSYFAHVPIPIR